MKAHQAKLESEKRKFKEALEISEQRATKLELARRALEGDLQRNKLSLTDKETSHQVQKSLFFLKNVLCTEFSSTSRTRLKQ